MTQEDFYNQGMAEFAMAEFDQAIEAFKKAVEMDATYFDAWHALGMAYMRADKHHKAIEAGERAVAINPNDMLAHTSLSMYYMKIGDRAKAEAEKGKATVLSWGGKVDQLDNKPPSV